MPSRGSSSSSAREAGCSDDAGGGLARTELVVMMEVL